MLFKWLRKALRVSIWVIFLLSAYELVTQAEVKGPKFLESLKNTTIMMPATSQVKKLRARLDYELAARPTQFYLRTVAAFLAIVLVSIYFRTLLVLAAIFHLNLMFLTRDYIVDGKLNPHEGPNLLKQLMLSACAIYVGGAWIFTRKRSGGRRRQQRAANDHKRQ